MCSGKNNTDDGELQIFTGLGDVSKLGTIVTFNNKTEEDIWPRSDEDDGQECNSIRGSDGSLFPPFVSKNQTFYIYNKEMPQAGMQWRGVGSDVLCRAVRPVGFPSCVGLRQSFEVRPEVDM